MSNTDSLRNEVEKSFAFLKTTEVDELRDIIYGCFGESINDGISDTHEAHRLPSVLSRILSQHEMSDYQFDKVLGIFLNNLSTIRSQQNRDRDLLIYNTCIGLVLVAMHDSPHFAKDVSELLLYGKFSNLALRFAERGRILFEAENYHRFPSDANCRIVYSMFLSQQSECYGACEDYINALNLRLKAIAINHNESDYSRIAQWSEKSAECPTVHTPIQPERPEFQKLIFHTTNVFVRDDNDKLDVIYSKNLPSRELKEPRHIGDVRDNFPSVSDGHEALVQSIKRARIYTDYWKTAVITESNAAQQTVSSGPHELIYIADKTGIGPSFEKVDGTVALVAARHSWIEYYHWLIEIMPRMHLLLESGAKFDKLVAHGSKTRAYCTEFFELANISMDHVIGDMDPISLQAETTLIPDFHCRINPSYIDFMKNLYIKDTSETKAKSKKIFISRQIARERKIVNFEAVSEILLKNNFDIIQFEDMKLQDQAKIMSEADVVMAPHGAGLSNLIFCKPGTKVYEYIGHGCPSCFRYVSQICNLEYTAVHSDWHGRDLLMNMDYFHNVLNGL